MLRDGLGMASGSRQGWSVQTTLLLMWFFYMALRIDAGPWLCVWLSVHVSVMAPQRGVCNRKVVIGEKFSSKFAGVGNKAYLCTRISEEGRLAQLV